jgi:hypothetical protein
VEGAFGDAADQTEACELASSLGVSLLPFWFGTLPANLDARLWRMLDTGQGALVLLSATLDLDQCAAASQVIQWARPQGFQQ